MVVLAVSFCFLFIVITGCAKKPVVKTEQPVVSEEQVAPQVVAKDEIQSEGKQAAVDEQQLVEQEMKEQAFKEQELREKALKEQALKKEQELEEKAENEHFLEAQEQEKAKAIVPAVSAIDIADIRFDFDKYSLSPEARAILEKHANWLLQHKDYYVLIEGHCDERGTNEYNLALGERRADEAMQYLMNLGVDEARIKTISYGEELPLDPNHNEEAWAKNRRDHFVLNIIRK